MRGFWLLSLLPAVLANPAPQQVTFSLNGHDNNVRNVVDQYLDAGKKAILRGKKNLENWYHDGKEYIKQNDLLCAQFILLLRLT